LSTKEIIMRPASRLATLTILATATFAAHADTIYSTFGPGQTFIGPGWNIGTVNPSVNDVIASPFIPIETVTLSDAVLALEGTEDNSPMTVYIESSAGGAPNTIIDTLTQVGSIPVFPSRGLVDFTCSSCSLLDAGTMYFIVAVQGDPSTQDGWLFSPTGTGTIYGNLLGSATGPWHQLPDADHFPAFEVNGTPAATPEPSTIALFGTGLLGLAGVARRKFHA
jgi:hypothetical protein